MIKIVCLKRQLIIVFLIVFKSVIKIMLSIVILIYLILSKYKTLKTYVLIIILKVFFLCLK